MKGYREVLTTILVDSDYRKLSTEEQLNARKALLKTIEEDPYFGSIKVDEKNRIFQGFLYPKEQQLDTLKDFKMKFGLDTLTR